MKDEDDDVVITWETALEPGRQQQRLDEFIRLRERSLVRLDGATLEDGRRGDHDETLPASLEVAAAIMQEAAARAGWDGIVGVSATATQLFVWLSRAQEGGVLQATGLIVGSGALASFESLQSTADAVYRAVRGGI